MFRSHVQIRDRQRVILNELAPRLHDVAHRLDEHVGGLVDLADFDLQQGVGVAVEDRLSELILVHLAWLAANIGSLLDQRCRQHAQFVALDDELRHEGCDQRGDGLGLIGAAPPAERLWQ